MSVPHLQLRDSPIVLSTFILWRGDYQIHLAEIMLALTDRKLFPPFFVGGKGRFCSEEVVKIQIPK